MLDLGGTPDSELFPAIELTALTCCPRCRPGNPADDPRVGQTDGVDIATLIAAGWSSGVNAYLTVLLLGSAGRLGLADTPESLQRNWVLGAAAVLYLIEFVVDKVPLLDSAWDAVHTFIRPAIGAALGVALVDGQTDQLVAALLAGGLALTGHAAKSTTRLAINTSPEPVTNVIASLGEDGLVATLVLLSLSYPKTAAGLALIAMVLSLALAFVLLRLARRGLRAIRS